MMSTNPPRSVHFKRPVVPKLPSAGRSKEHIFGDRNSMTSSPPKVSSSQSVHDSGGGGGGGDIPPNQVMAELMNIDQVAQDLRTNDDDEEEEAGSQRFHQVPATPQPSPGRAPKFPKKKTALDNGDAQIVPKLKKQKCVLVSKPETSSADIIKLVPTICHKNKLRFSFPCGTGEHVFSIKIE